MGKLFGTDGIRGVAGKSPLTSAEVFRLGLAAGHVLKEKFPDMRCRLLGVRYTRGSGEGILADIAAGLRETGIDFYDAGVLNTPSVAYLAKAHRFQSGVVISASHNPPSFNGIKFFTSQGFKWPDTWENSVEEFFFGKFSTGVLRSKKPSGNLVKAETLAEDYTEFLFSTLGKGADFSSFRLALDCANGANYELGPRVFRKLGAEVFLIGAHPSGSNINVGCGSQHPEKLAKVVREKKCDLGIAFDGDGDRVVLVDEKGSVIDGDFVIALLAKHFRKKKLLRNRMTVITVMANLGLKKALAKLGVRSVETPVGDRYVSEAMRKHRCVLGGEQSGHIILGRHLPSGDGLLTALHVLLALQEEKKPFSHMVSWIQKFPQVLLNVPVREKRPLGELNGVQKKIDSIEKILGKNGRVLVRYSGTEPLLRIMLEGPDQKQLNGFAGEIAREVTTAIR